MRRFFGGPLPHPFYSPDAAGDVNSTTARPEPEMEWPEGDLPEQGFGPRTTIMPGIYLCKLPQDLTPLWKTVAMKDTRKMLDETRPNPNFGLSVQRRVLAFDRNHPLVVVGGKYDGEPMTWRVSSNPRARGKKDDPNTPWISDVAYLYTVGLDIKQRVKTVAEMETAINTHGGAVIRLETGLSAQCRPDRVRRICVETPDGPVVVEDGQGTKGCGARYYSNDLRDPQTGNYDLEVACDCGQPDAEQAAAGAVPVIVVVRAFENVERILPPA